MHYECEWCHRTTENDVRWNGRQVCGARCPRAPHDVSISDGGVCIGWGKTYTPYCLCGWHGNSELYRFQAISEGERHAETAHAAQLAEAMGAV